MTRNRLTHWLRRFAPQASRDSGMEHRLAGGSNPGIQICHAGITGVVCQMKGQWMQGMPGKKGGQWEPASDFREGRQQLRRRLRAFAAAKSAASKAAFDAVL